MAVDLINLINIHFEGSRNCTNFYSNEIRHISGTIFDTNTHTFITVQQHEPVADPDFPGGGGQLPRWVC